MRMNGQSVAVFDIGSARIKLTVGTSERGAVSFRGMSRDVALLSGDDTDRLEAFREALTSLRAAAVDSGCNYVIAAGTEAMRAQGPDSEYYSAALQIIGQLCIIAPVDEARLFFEAVNLMGSLSPKSVLVDVGGGSVQAIWGSARSQMGTAAIGTFAIERKFQGIEKEAPVFGTKQFVDMMEYIDVALRGFVPAELSADTLVVGSNTMADFFASAATVACVPFEVHALGSALVSDDFHSLAMKIWGTEYRTAGRFFSENPRFMFGADKLLMVIHCLQELLKPNTIIGTNMSMSKGAALIAIREPYRLKEFGLERIPLIPR